MADRLARHAEHPAELLLADTPAGGGRTIRYRLDHPLIGAVDQRRFGVERLQQSTCNSEFAILRYPVSNTPSNNDAATARKKDQHPSALDDGLLLGKDPRPGLSHPAATRPGTALLAVPIQPETSKNLAVFRVCHSMGRV